MLIKQIIVWHFVNICDLNTNEKPTSDFFMNQYFYLKLYNYCIITFTYGT